MEAKKRLGELLIDAGVIDETQLQSALGHQRRWGMKLGQALLDLKLATEPQVVAALARKFGYEVANLGALQAGPLLEGALRLVPREVATKHTLLPIAADTNSITVAMSDPTNIAVVDELSFRTGRRVRISIAGERELASAIRRLYFGEEARKGPEPIDIEESDTVLETTTDPFSALPDPVREEMLGRPAAAEQPPPKLTPPPVLAPARPPPAAPPATPPVVYPTAPAVTPAVGPPFRPAPPPSVAAPPLPQAAGYRPPPAVPSPLPADPAASAASGRVASVAELVAPAEARRLSPREVALADAVERLTRDAAGPGAAAVAALVRLLVRKGFFTEVEFLDELSRR
jgi:type IV pilus assembly protein PilB